MLILEVHYSGKISDELHYDSIYHEHLCYFTLKSLVKLLNLYDLFVYDINESPISGGSIVVYALGNQKEKSENLLKFEETENTNKYNDFELWQEFARKSFEHKKCLSEIIASEIASGKRVIAYGASARSSTMLNFCEINNIDLIIDKNELKQNKYTPGSHLKIVDADNIPEENPDTVLILAWNFKDEIISFLRDKYNFKGDVIIPLPYPPYMEDLKQ